MQRILVRDSQVVLILTKAEVKELRYRLGGGHGVQWSNTTDSIDRKALAEIDRLGI